MDKRPIMNKWYTRLISVALVLVVLCQMGWPGKIMVADAEESGTTVVTSGDVTPGDAGYAEKSVAEQYLEEIAALKSEALLIDGTSADVTLMCADVYERLMGVYAEAVDAYDAGAISAEEYTEIYNATGEIIEYLNSAYGYNPYAIETTDTTTSIRYYHFDIRIDAEVTVKVLNEDGTTTEETVNATISNPTAVIYNTGTTSWTGTGTTEDGIAYKSVSFNKSTGENTENEYMDSKRRNEFYTGDTLALTYTLTYTTEDGETHSVQLDETRVVVQDENVCSKKDDDGHMRGFDIVVSTENISAAMSTSMLQIAKYWDDNSNVDKRPDTITVNISQTVNSEEKQYMTLTLAKDAGNANFAMASGITKDEETKVTFTDDYGVSITGLPQNYWIKNEDNTYSYVSCSYNVKEVQASGDANLKAVYGTFVYVDDTQTNSYIVTITNTLAYEKLAVLKTWTDNDSVNHNSDSVKVQLKAYYEMNGVKTEVPDKWLEDFIGGSTVVTLNTENNWYAVWGNMPVYYTPDSSAFYPIVGFEAIETNVTAENGEKYTATVSEISESKDNSGNYYFTVTNTPVPKTTSVTVTKTVTGGLGDWNKEFSFTAVLKDSEGDVMEFPEPEENGNYTLSDDRKTAYFGLKNDGSITFNNIPLDATIVIYETDASGYTVKINGEEDSDWTFSKDVSGEMTIAFENNKEVTPDTGILLDSLPYLLILVIVIAGVVIMILRRRRSYDED